MLSYGRPGTAGVPRAKQEMLPLSMTAVACNQLLRWTMNATTNLQKRAVIACSAQVSRSPAPVTYCQQPGKSLIKYD